MMIVCFVLELYFAAVLVVSGFAKVQSPASFASTLLRQHLLPQWSIRPISLVFPWVEVAFAGTLVVGLAPILAAFFLCALFVGFLSFEVVLVVTKRVTDCGCFGPALKRTVDGTSLSTSALLVALTALHAWAVFHSMIIGWTWRLLPTVMFCIVSGWMWLGAKRQRSNAAAYIMNTPQKATSANSSQIVRDYTHEPAPPLTSSSLSSNETIMSSSTSTSSVTAR